MASGQWSVVMIVIEIISWGLGIHAHAHALSSLPPHVRPISYILTGVPFLRSADATRVDAIPHPNPLAGIVLSRKVE